MASRPPSFRDKGAKEEDFGLEAKATKPPFFLATPNLQPVTCHPDAMPTNGLLQRIGPAFIVGACIIGPGSVTLMSRTGALYGYSMLWLALLSGALMAGFIALFMHFGIHSPHTFLEQVRLKLGRWVAVLCGLSLASVNATFQFGNNLGVTAATSTMWEGAPKLLWPLFFTGLSVVFLFAFKNIYQFLEKLMTSFLILMALAFVLNLGWARPSLAGVARGAFVPSIPEGADWLTLGGLVATTFVIVAAFFQAYLVKAKGWSTADLNSGITDTVLAAIMYSGIGCVIMMTAAAVLYPDRSIDSATAMATQLEGAFGPYAKLIFCVGFWAAAFSSFVTNALVGGVLLNDGLGLGGQLNSLGTRIFATLVLLIGMGTAMAIIHSDSSVGMVAVERSGSEATKGAASESIAEPKEKGQIEIRAIALAQALSILAVPLGVIAMVVVLFDGSSMPGHPLSAAARGFVLLGAAVLLGIALMTALKVRPAVMDLFGS